MRKPFRAPASDELWVVPDGYRRLDERVYLSELSAYLNCKTGRLKRLANRWGSPVRRQHILSGTGQWWVTPQTAMRMIAAVRAHQGKLIRSGRTDVVKRALVGRQQRLLNKRT